MLSAGVDWLTVTTADSVSSDQLLTHTTRIVEDQVQLGAIAKPWGMSGFTGFKVGQVELGQRGDEAIVRLMSEAAQIEWRRVYELGTSCTRLDLQVTVDMKSECQRHVFDYYKRANKISSETGKKNSNRVVLGNDGGATLYCGARTSNRFGRIYAKGPQSKMDHFKQALRFEVQFNGKLARTVVGRLHKSKVQEMFTLERAVAFFGLRIGHVPFRASFVANDSCPRSRSDCRQKLEWLKMSVKPSVQLLMNSGYSLEVMRALGLDHETAGPVREFE